MPPANAAVEPYPKRATPGPQRAYCFTVHAPHAEAWTLPPEAPAGVQYVVWQYEKCPTTGALHIQGYAEFLKPCRIAGARKLLSLPPTTHFEARRGTKEEARNYCMKEETRVDGPYERGIWNPATTGGEKSRLSLVAFKEFALAPENVADYTKTERWYRDNYIEIYDRHHRAFTAIMDELSLRRVPQGSPIELRPWQELLLRHLRDEPLTRRIFWVWSEASGTGKTTFVDYLVREGMRDAVLVGTWSYRDTLYAYRPGEHRVVAFNVPRDTHGDKMEGYLALLERMSDHGAQLSTKYASTMKYVASHVLVTANIPPPYHALPQRIVEVRLDPHELEWPRHPQGWRWTTERAPHVNIPLHEEAPPDAAELDSDWDPATWNSWKDYY